jgi:integrase
MATIFKNAGNKKYFARFIDAEGKRISRCTHVTTKLKAEAIAAEMELMEQKKKKGNADMATAFAAIINAAARDAESGDLTLARAEELVTRLHRLANPDFRVVSLDQHLGSWVKAQEAHVEHSTMNIYRDMHRRIIENVGSKIAAAPVGNLTKENIEAAMRKIITTNVRKSKTRTITAATANMDLHALRRALTAALEAGLVKMNVAASIRPLPTTDSTERAPFTTEEVRKMLDHEKTSDEWKGAILIAAHTGLRMGDVMQITRENIEGTRLVIRPAKTKKERETLNIPLTPPVIAWIGKRKGSLFPKLSTLQKGTLSTTFTRIMKSAGVARDIIEAGNITKRRSFHSLRHTFASWLAEADIHADVRQKLTGHKSAGIHANYTHHDKALDRAVGTLPEF